MTALPGYRDLLARTDQPSGSSWGLFGPDDHLGTVNLTGPGQARAGAASVLTGEVFTLDYALNAFDPPLAATRSAPGHRMFRRHQDHRDDVIETLYPQASSQLDGLRHRRHHRHGFYNGVSDAEVDEGTALGIQHWSEHGIVGRGLLLDVAAARADAGRAIDHAVGEHLTAGDLESAVTAQGTSPETGDILLLHTGWAHWYLSDPGHQDLVRRERRFTGLDQDPLVLEWLWDHHVAVAGSDTYALEALPAAAGSPYGRETDQGMMHQQLIALLGLAVGELWRLTPLARACATDRRYTCLLVAKPLNLPRGVGSPANATAVR